MSGGYVQRSVVHVTRVGPMYLRTVFVYICNGRGTGAWGAETSGHSTVCPENNDITYKTKVLFPRPFDVQTEIKGNAWNGHVKPRIAHQSVDILLIINRRACANASHAQPMGRRS